MNKERISAKLRGREFIFDTGSGTFSKTKVDNGTTLLVNEAQMLPGQKILDLGCGYGVLGIAIKKTCSQCVVTLTDINERAVKLAQENAKLNLVDVEVLSGDRYDSVKGRVFDVIFLNPPQTAGRELCNSMIEQAFDHLETDGFFWLVARHQIGGKMFEKKMEDVFGNVETIARESGFRVYRSKKTI